MIYCPGMQIKKIPDPRQAELAIRKKTDLLVVHRCAKLGTRPMSAIRALRQYWARQAIAYHFFIDHEGRVYGVEGLERKRYHALIANRRSIGIALLCDGRKESAPPVMVDGLVRLCHQLLGRYELKQARIRRHDQIVGGSKWIGKVCPGPGVPVEWVKMRLSETFSK